MLSQNEINQIIDRVIEREGGYVDHPKDPGGRTKYGISQRSYPDLDIQGLSKTDARRIYERDFVRKFRIDQCPHLDVAEQVLDFVVHSGAGAIREIQRAVGIRADGIVGPQTLRALTAMTPQDVLRIRLKFLVRLTDHPFIVGWTNRLIDMGL